MRKYIYQKYSARTHGATADGKRTPAFTSWLKMRERCYDPNNNQYHNYGGRGVTVCARWRKFENFLADMGPRPPGTSLDRWPNKNGNYKPGNCRWATPLQQSNNARNNVVINLGMFTGTLSEWCTALKLNPKLTSQRIVRDGLTPREALLGR